MEGKDIAIMEDRDTALQSLSTKAVVAQVQQIQEIMRAVMKEDEHYGKIPGTDKPTLLKPGAEKLCFTFRLAPERDYTWRELGGGHRECQCVSRLRHIPTGQLVGEGIGVCSTMESKYRYRNVADFEVLDDPIPEDAREHKQAYRKQGFGMKKLGDGSWAWVKYGDSARQENPDIADTYNTVAKMATKRADVAATLTATAASDIFTQDLEETTEERVVSPPPATGKKKPSQESAAILDEIGKLVEKNGLDEAARARVRARIAAAHSAQALADIRDDLKPKDAALDAAADAGFEGKPA